MKIKRGQTKKLFLAFLLTLTFVVGSIPVTAANSKISVTDNDSDGKISIGDEFCLGSECFYVLSNKDGNIKALSKYNLNAGYTAYKVDKNSELVSLYADYMSGYTSDKRHAFYDKVFTEEYYNCTGAGFSMDDGYLLCYKSLTFDINVAKDTDNPGYQHISNSEMSDLGCLYSNYEYLGAEDGVAYNHLKTCMTVSPKNEAIKQSSLAIGAHGGAKGQPEYPEVANYYFNNTLPEIDTRSNTHIMMDPNLDISYDKHNELIRDKVPEGTGSNRDGLYYNPIYNSVFKYKDYLTGQNFNIKDADLLSYNDLADALTTVNKKGVNFAHDGYGCGDNDWVENADGSWSCRTNPWTWKYANKDESIGHIEGYDYGYDSIKEYVPDQYGWLYSTTYWLKTGFWNLDYSDDIEEGDIARTTMYNYEFFVDTLGDLCFVNGQSYCDAPNIGAGVRPVITMSADDFEINSFDIVGTVRWIDDNNSSRIRPGISTIKLYRNGAFVQSIQVQKDEDEDLWRFSFMGLPKYDNNGELYNYTITQDDVPMYSSSIINFDVVNRYTPSSDKPVEPAANADNPKTSTGSPLMYASGAVILAGVAILTLKAKRR